VEVYPDLPGQEVDIQVTGTPDDLIQGLDLYVQIADGGPEAVPMGFATIGVDAPAITGADLLSGTIFQANHAADGVVSRTVVPQIWEAGIATEEGEVRAHGLLATLTFDTTGFGEDWVGQIWDLALRDVGGAIAADTNLLGQGPPELGAVIPAAIVGGTMIEIIPLPTTELLNGDFQGDSLSRWKIRGAGTGQTIEFPEASGEFAAELTSIADTALQQTIDTLDVPYLLTFDMLFPEGEGVLEVSIDGQVVDTVSALAPMDDFATTSIVISDPALLALDDTQLAFHLSGPGDVQVLLDNIAIAEVPEPASLALMLLAVLGLCIRRKLR